ncbi:MAG: hypothetical protein EPN21_02720 [Methylococcaceae bacterium]|nr:MAG: hypothetical protein EPN21_02720 [Methylococcaceae bacterium]
MLKKLFFLFVTSLTLTLSGCAEYGGYRPTVDVRSDANPQNLARDEEECQAIAKRAAGGAAKEAATGAVVGGLIGAAGGAALGAITGNPGRGAALGAAAGGISGGAYKGINADDRYKNAFNSCMRQRNHSVVD